VRRKLELRGLDRRKERSWLGIKLRGAAEAVVRLEISAVKRWVEES